MGPWSLIKTAVRTGLSAFTVAVSLALCSEAVAQSDPLEYAVKATYLYKFVPFVEWPDSAFASPSSPVILCIVGADPFGDLVDRAVSGETAGRRPIEVRRLHSADRTAGCHIMYVAGSATQSAAEALHAVRGTPVLTVTDARQGGAARGIIHFVIRDDRVRFAVDDRAAAANGLEISSKLLSLATSVRSRSG